MGELREILRRNLAYYLDENNLSQKLFAEKLEVSQSAVTNWIKGKNSPDIELIAKMCTIFDVEITDLMSEKSTIESNNEIPLILQRQNDLLHNYEALNPLGQQTLLLQSKMMLDQNEYKKANDDNFAKTQSFKVAASNGKDTIELTKEQRAEMVRQSREPQEPLDDEL